MLLEPTPLTGGSRKSDAKHPAFLSWPDVGLEFNPWIGAYLELSGNKQWQDFATPAIGSWGDWFSKAEISGREQVQVPAGSFDMESGGLEQQARYRWNHYGSAGAGTHTLRNLVCATGQTLCQEHTNADSG